MDNKKKELISNYLDGELNAEDSQTAELLISEDMDVRKLYEEIKSVDTLIDTLPVLTPTEEMRNSFKQKLAKEKSEKTKERKLQRILLYSTRFAVAASIMLLVSIAVVILMKTTSTPPVAPQPPVADTKIDEDMYKYVELLTTEYDFDYEVLANIDESTFEEIENKTELSLVDAALLTKYQGYENSSND